MATTELEAVNQILSMIGQSPVSTLTAATNPDVIAAVNVLDEATRELQAQRCSWNEVKTILPFDDIYTNSLVSGQANMAIPIPTPQQIGYNFKLLSHHSIWHSKWKNCDLTIRNDRIWDRVRSTDDMGGVPVSVVGLLSEDFDDIPEHAKILVTRMAARKMAERFVGEPRLIASAREDEGRARITFSHAEDYDEAHNPLTDSWQGWGFGRRISPDEINRGGWYGA